MKAKSEYLFGSQILPLRSAQRKNFFIHLPFFPQPKLSTLQQCLPIKSRWLLCSWWMISVINSLRNPPRPLALQPKIPPVASPTRPPTSTKSLQRPPPHHPPMETQIPENFKNSTHSQSSLSKCVARSGPQASRSATSISTSAASTPIAWQTKKIVKHHPNPSTPPLSW